MLAKARSHLSYANVMATIAVFIALGGSSYAALTITGKQVKNGSLTGADVKNHSLGAVDLRRGVLKRGPKGDPGPKGDTGTVDTGNFYDKATADARFLGIGAASSLRAFAVHDERTVPAYAANLTAPVRSVTVQLDAPRHVLLMGTAETWSTGGRCRFFIGLRVDGTDDGFSDRGAVAPDVPGTNGFATAATTTLKTLGAGSHTVDLRGATLDNSCVGFQNSSLEAVVLDG